MPRRFNDKGKGSLAGIFLAMVAMMGSAAAMASQPDTVEITIKAQQGFQFEPAELEVPATGVRVVLTLENEAVMGHNLHIPELDVMTETITAGKTDAVEFTIDKSGTYAFRCEVPGHAEAGMTGELKVR